MGATGQFEFVTHWAAELPANDGARAAAIRLDVGAEGAFSAGRDSFWLRGEKLNDAVLSLPFLGIYRIESGKSDRLFPLDSELPCRRLPADLVWHPVVDMVIPKPEVPLFPGEDFLQLAEVKVVRGGTAAVSNLLRLSRASFREYVETAPQIRLDGLTFAASQTEILVKGNPLPPVRGEGWFLEDGIALSAGYVLSPSIARSVLHQSLGLVSGEIALISFDGLVEKIAEENFVPVSRSAMRLTMV